MIKVRTPKHGDASAAYWKLYGNGSRINDKNLVGTLMNNTSSMIIMVRGDTYR